MSLPRQVSIRLPSSSTHDWADGSVSSTRAYCILQMSPEECFSEYGNSVPLYLSSVSNILPTKGKKCMDMDKVDSPDRMPILQLDD